MYNDISITKTFVRFNFKNLLKYFGLLSNILTKCLGKVENKITIFYASKTTNKVQE